MTPQQPDTPPPVVASHVPVVGAARLGDRGTAEDKAVLDGLVDRILAKRAAGTATASFQSSI